jgi:hypothetical protein
MLVVNRGKLADWLTLASHVHARCAGIRAGGSVSRPCKNGDSTGTARIGINTRLQSMAHNAKKTEHAGPKKGRGAFYGRKAEAKRQSNRRRREDAKLEVAHARVVRTRHSDAVA